MAKWSSGWKWSDGTKWASGFVAIQVYTSFIDRLLYRGSIFITHVAPAGSTSAPTIATISAELGPRAQLPHGYEAFIDRNEETQHISARVISTYDSTAETELTTEGGDTLLTEASESLTIGLIAPFTIDIVSMLANQRSRVQPTG